MLQVSASYGKANPTPPVKSALLNRAVLLSPVRNTIEFETAIPPRSSPVAVLHSIAVTLLAVSVKILNSTARTDVNKHSRLNRQPARKLLHPTFVAPCILPLLPFQ